MTRIKLFILSLIVLVGCQQYDDDLDPVASFSLSKTTVNTFEVVNLKNTGAGEFYTIYTGAEGSQYANREQGDSGIPGNQNGDASFSYTKPGVYEVAFVVSTYADGEVKESVSFKSVSVHDTLNTLSKISFQDIGEYYRSGNTNASFYAVESIPNAQKEVLVPVLNYRHFGYQNRSSLPLVPTISVASEAAEIIIEKNQNYTRGDRVIHTNFEERFRPLTYTVKPANGEGNDYLVSVVEIPEFEEFTLNGVASINKVHPSDDQVFFLTAPASAGQDLTSLTPTFSLFYPAETSVYHNGADVSNGTDALDFTNVVTFQLEFEQEDYESVFHVDSEVHVKALEVPGFENYEVEGVAGTISLESAGNLAVYHIDVELPADQIPEGQTARTWLRSLKPTFSVPDAEGVETVSIEKGGVQISGETQNDFSAYYLEYEENPNSFDLDDLRKTYYVDRTMDLQTDSLTYEKAFSLRTIYKVGIIVK
ncbi:hypothetical protein [Marinoscillum furvescens]|uniref:Uncharacterized protein n=1 Tax=Marinoscillum furvescens DSM 4134 TaxID=1122208 RepID=A0A3D9L6G4_MARFU|nr:hypothetical protein [Marinoscillum furvescens]REE00167.1 hypothetical protein C7460_106106 [Marinoscillum furvescens DSM 4134]